MKVPVNFKTEEITRNEAKVIFEQLGTDMTTAINMFLKFVCREKMLPYEIVGLINDYNKRQFLEEVELSLLKSQEEIANNEVYDLHEEMAKIRETYGFK